MKWHKISRILRSIVLLGLLAYVTYESYMHQVLGGGKSPSIHALCPFGALESLYTLLFMGSFIQKIYSGTVVLLVLTVVLAIIFRRSFCGLLCPFGALQELFAILGQKIFKKRFTIPKGIDAPLRYLKYLLLLLTVVMSWYYGKLWMAPYDPYSAYSHLSAFSDSIAEDPLAIVGFILLAITVLGSFLYDRFFCKYLCPVGAFYGIIGKISPTRIERKNELCVHCNLCNKACPINIDVVKATIVTNAECINCNECVAVCPKQGALEVTTAGKAIHPVAMLTIVVALFFGTILTAQATGNYQIIPSALKEGQIIPISEIKGYNTIEEAAQATGLTLQEIYAKMGIPENVTKDTKMKEISKEAAGYNFDEAKEKAGGTEAEAAKTEAAKTEATETEVAETIIKETAASQGSNNTLKVDISGIKGKMTIREAAGFLKIELKDFYQLFKIPDKVPPQTQLKGIAIVSPGYDFEKVKESLK